MALRLWELHGDGRTVTPGAVVRPEERLSWGTDRRDRDAARGGEPPVADPPGGGGRGAGDEPGDRPAREP